MKSVAKKSIREIPFYRLLTSLIAIIFISEVLIMLIETPDSADKLALSLIDATVLSLITLITVLPFLIRFKKLSIATEDALAEAFDDLRHQKFALDQHAIVATTDVQGTITYVNEKFCAVSGYKQAELLGQNHRMLNSGTHPSEFFREMYRTIASGKVWSGEICNRAKDGSLYWVMSTIVPSIGANGKPYEYIAIRADITERKKAEEEVRHQKFALDQHAIVATTDVQGTITYVNEKFCAVSGYKQAELLGQNHRMLNSGTHPSEFFREMYRTIASGKVWSGEICNRAKDGSLYWVMSTIVPSIGPNGKPYEYIAIRADITERKKAEEEVRQLAFYDTLTKLPNRRMLYERLSQALQLSKRSACYGAIMFLDLDNFKPLNDTYGHAVGDLLLIQAASRLKNCVREIDVVARFGGDEFVVMISELDVDESLSKSKAETVAEKIRGAMSEPYLLNTNQVGLTDNEIKHHCTASIGVSLFGNDKVNQNDIMKWADDAMYQAKAAGRNMIRFYV